MHPPTTCSSYSSQALLDRTVATTATIKSPQRNDKSDMDMAGSSPNNVSRSSPQLHSVDVKPNNYNYQTSQQQQQQQQQHLTNNNHHYISRNATKIIKGEIHNVCLTMQSDPRYYISRSTSNNSSSDGGDTAAMMRRSR